MDRTEKVGLAGAVAAHLLLLGLLSLKFTPEPHSFDNPPMAVEIIAEAAPVSTAPKPSTESPAPRRGEVDAPIVPAPPPVATPEPKPQVQPQRAAPPPSTPPQRSTPQRTPQQQRQAPTRPPQTTPPPRREERQQPRREERQQERQEDPRDRRRPDRESAPAATPRRTTPQRTGPASQNVPRTPQRTTPRPAPTPPARDAGDPLGDIAASVARNANGRGRNPPAAQTAAQVRADIRVSINAEVRPHWNGCRVTGIDVDQLRTTVVFALRQNGTLDRVVSVNTTGVTDSNRPQVARFEECARRAIQLAAPFSLPAEHYATWQTYTLDFEKR